MQDMKMKATGFIEFVRLGFEVIFRALVVAMASEAHTVHASHSYKNLINIAVGSVNLNYVADNADTQSCVHYTPFLQDKCSDGENDAGSER